MSKAAHPKLTGGGEGGQSIVNSNELDPLALRQDKIKCRISHSPVKCLICASFRVPDSARISLAETPCKSSAMCLLDTFLPLDAVVDVVDDDDVDD